MLLYRSSRCSLWCIVALGANVYWYKNRYGSDWICQNTLSLLSAIADAQAVNHCIADFHLPSFLILQTQFNEEWGADLAFIVADCIDIKNIRLLQELCFYSIRTQCTFGGQAFAN
jgi:hypothetical protein